jgi:plastocyanin
MTRSTIRLMALQATLGASLLAGCFSERTTEPGDTAACDGTAAPCAIEIRDNSFAPGTRRVTLGSTVRWTNEGSSPHTSTALADEWDSGNLNSGQSYEHTFEAAGSFDYECIYHDGMTGTIVVE